MSDIVLATLNARYIHASLGLRCVLANMGELESRTRLAEYVIGARPLDIVEDLLGSNPRIIGLGVYLWNVTETTQVVALLREIRPDIVIVLGGPEVSHEWQRQEIVRLADHVITGAGDLAFGDLCARLLTGERPVEKIMPAPEFPLEQIALPYRLYSDEDIAQRVLYVEASRGCPFRCEFCLSALDRTARPFDLEHFLAEMQALHVRGARRFKFVDRTFNLNIRSSIRILEFFLERLDERLFLHFEVIPDHLPAALREVIRRFPQGSLQLEVGVQTFNPEVQALISRRQDNRKTEENLYWLRNESHAHLHADLIIGLPGEDMASFAQGFDRLVSLRPHEIQVGILKRLRGAPIARHSEDFGMRYNPQPPYNILCSDLIDFQTMQRLTRFARYWDMIANTGRFRHTLALLLGNSPFARFLHLSDWLYAGTGQTHKITLARLFALLHQGLITELGADEDRAEEVLLLDYRRSGLKGPPPFTGRGQRENRRESESPRDTAPRRQARHLGYNPEQDVT